MPPRLTRLGSMSTIHSVKSILPTISEPTVSLTYTNVESNIISSESIYSPSISEPSRLEFEPEDIDFLLPHNSTPETTTFLDLNMFPNPYNLTEQEFFTRHIEISKENDSFHDKLKQFFILSSAGKPIYSMNGSDEIIIGYMGIITTIISTFEENMNQELYSVTIDNVKLVALNKSPIILVSISKIIYEAEDQVLGQLKVLYDYLLSILSKPIIDKNFHNKLNYDLRRILTSLDFHNLDCLCMKMTFGILSDFEFYICHLLNVCLPNLKMSYTIRQKLNKILQDSRKSLEIESDLLFSILTCNGKIISFVKSKHHSLTNEDLSLLFSIIESSKSQITTEETTEDMWFPICMPNFNSNGFLYVFVKTWKQLTIILLSSNKNSFYQIQNIANNIIHKITKKDTFLDKLTRELNSSNNLSILRQIPLLHFIYKNKHLNQFIMSESQTSPDTYLQMGYFYNILIHTKASDMKQTSNLNFKKFTYCKWSNIVGLMISDNNYEFYCLSPPTTSQQLIQYSLNVIKWCQHNHNRIFT